MTALRIVLGGLWLPFKLYLKPYTFRREVAALAPDLPENYTVWKARHHFRKPEVRRGFSLLMLQAVIALAWAPIVGWLSQALGFEFNWVHMLIRVAFGVAFGVTFGVTFGVAVGVAFGVALGVAVGVAFGVAVDVAVGVAFGVAFGVTFGVLGEVAFGVAFGVVGGVVFRVLGGVTVGVTIGVAWILTSLHLINLFLELPISLSSWLISKLHPRSSRWLWRICPVRWDDVILLPLPGLPNLLATLVRQNAALGNLALQETSEHKFQYRAAFKARSLLAQQDAQWVSSLPSLAVFNQGLAWLTEDTPLPQTLRSSLLQLRDISLEVSSALESDSATNRVRRLQQAKDKLAILAQRPLREFALAVNRWAGLVEAGLNEAIQQQRKNEPIPMVYSGDGRPVSPGVRGDEQIPFKGRRALFKRLEQALGGNEGERATYLLIGQGRTGKTSALLQLERRLGSGVVPAFLDLQNPKLGGAGDVGGLLHGWAEAVNDEGRRRGVILPDLTRRELGSDPYPAFGRWLDKLEKALGERRLLMCLDEFEALEQGIAEGRFDTRVLSTLRNIVQHRRRINVLLSGRHQIDELPPHWASALINTLSLPISYLEEADARELIVQPVADFPDIYRPETVDRIISLTHRQPYLIQLLCQLLVKRMNDARRMPPDSWVEVADVDAVIPLALEHGATYFSDLWRGQIGGETAQTIIDAIAQQPDLALEVEDLRRLVPDEQALNKAVRTLLRREIIAKDQNGRFNLLVPLVAEYCRAQRVI